MARNESEQEIDLMSRLYKVPLRPRPQPAGGYTVTSPVLPEPVTEGEDVEEALANARDALKAVLEIYDDLGRTLPEHLRQDPLADPIRFEHLLLEA
jgi:antitoxin HicB